MLFLRHFLCDTFLFDNIFIMAIINLYKFWQTHWQLLWGCFFLIIQNGSAGI